MNLPTEPAAMTALLSGHLSAILDKHKGPLVAQVTGHSGVLTQAILKDDETARKVANYCYEFLPWPVRMAVKQAVFTDFVLAHREPILAKLSPASN